MKKGRFFVKNRPSSSGLIIGVTGEQYNNGTSIGNTPSYATTYTYDNAMRIMNKTNTVNNVAYSEDYTYDTSGNRTVMQEETDGIRTKIIDYTYDELNRLTGYNSSVGATVSYNYDVAGNMTDVVMRGDSGRAFPVTVNGTPKTLNATYSYFVEYTYNTANQLTASTEYIDGEASGSDLYLEIDKNYTYDANGNTTAVTSSGDVDTTTETFTYNARNQLVDYTKGSDSVSYGYDGTGMRVSKTQGNTTQKYYWDRGYIANEGTGNTITASNFIGADGIIARKENNVVNYLVKNAHGDVIKYVGASNTKHYDYDPYGNELNANPNDTNPFRYAGEYFDAESGQIYLRNRYYSPSTGRFTQEDPIRDGTNWYTYCAGNPVMYVDPWGLGITLIFVDPDMVDQAEVRSNSYQQNSGTTVQIIEVSSAKEFENNWNYWMGGNYDIDSIELLFHGGATEEVGKDEGGTAYSTGYMEFFDYSRLYARKTSSMTIKDSSVDFLKPGSVSSLYITACNSANPDIYNIVYGFMQIVDANQYSGFDGGSVWNPDQNDHTRGYGEYGRTWAHPFDPTHYVVKYQSTWWHHVEKNAKGAPTRQRIGKRIFNATRKEITI